MNDEVAQDDPYRSPETELSGVETDLHPATPCPACQTPPGPFSSWQVSPWRFRCGTCKTLFGMRVPHLATIVVGTVFSTLITLVLGLALGTYLGWPLLTLALACLLLTGTLVSLGWQYQLRHCRLYYLAD